jgi:GAF domain-containing protein
MAARAIWKGTIHFGTTDVPVKLYSAVEDRSIHFRLLDAKRKEPITQRMVDPDSGKPLASEAVGTEVCWLDGNASPFGIYTAAYAHRDQPIVLDDVSQDPRFAEEAAKKTGYVPNGLMCVPLIHEEEPLGVLYVLDRPQQARFSLEEVDIEGWGGTLRCNHWRIDLRSEADT